MAYSDLGGRLPLLRPASLTSDARALYDRLTKGRLSQAPFVSGTEGGALIGPFNAFLYAPGIAGGFIDFHEAEEHGTPLSARVREVVILSVGAIWQAPYEIYAHRSVAARVGFSPEVVTALATGKRSDGLNAEEQAAQRFTLELAGVRSVSEETYVMAKDVFGQEGMVALAFLAAAYSATCVMLNAFAVPAPSI